MPNAELFLEARYRDGIPAGEVGTYLWRRVQMSPLGRMANAVRRRAMGIRTPPEPQVA